MGLRRRHHHHHRRTSRKDAVRAQKDLTSRTLAGKLLIDTARQL